MYNIKRLFSILCSNALLFSNVSANDSISKKWIENKNFRSVIEREISDFLDDEKSRARRKEHIFPFSSELLLLGCLWGDKRRSAKASGELSVLNHKKAIRYLEDLDSEYFKKMSESYENFKMDSSVYCTSFLCRRI